MAAGADFPGQSADEARSSNNQAGLVNELAAIWSSTSAPVSTCGYDHTSRSW